MQKCFLFPYLKHLSFILSISYSTRKVTGILNEILLFQWFRMHFRHWDPPAQGALRRNRELAIQAWKKHRAISRDVKLSRAEHTMCDSRRPVFFQMTELDVQLSSFRGLRRSWLAQCEGMPTYSLAEKGIMREPCRLFCFFLRREHGGRLPDGYPARVRSDGGAAGPHDFHAGGRHPG